MAMNRICLNKGGKLLVIGSILGAFLSGCGGGSGGGTNPPASIVISGTAAVGSPIVNGSIAARCAAGGALSATTNSTGSWQVTLSSGHALPCALQVSGGIINDAANTTSYHSIATAQGIVNVTPLTDLMVANLAGTATPNVWFDGLNTNPGLLTTIKQADVDASLTRLRTALSGLPPLGTVNPLSTAFTPTPGNVSDDMLVALHTAMTSSGVTYPTLLGNASAPTFTAPAASLNTTLTTAYAGTASGSTIAGLSGTYDLTASDGTTATVTFDSTGNVSSCKVSTVVVCSGQLTLDSTTGTASFQVSGNDGLNPVDTAASLRGTIGTNGGVSGSYSGSSVSSGAFSGTFSGSKAGAAPGQYGTVTIAGLNSHQQAGTLELGSFGGAIETLIDTLSITSDGTYTFATPYTSDARWEKILKQPAGQVCAATKLRQDHFDPYTGQLITQNTADYYCFESPCGDLLSLGQAPAPKGLTATMNPDSTITVSWQNDPWADWYHIYYGTDQNVVTSDPVTGFAIYQNQTLGLSTTTSTGKVPPGTYYVAISSIYGNPANLAVCQSKASIAVPVLQPTSAAPTVSSISPSSGAVGTVVTITGANFDTTPANNTVTFNGTQATVTSSTATTITVTVPSGATTGTISVTTAGGAATSTSFTVLPSGGTGLCAAEAGTYNGTMTMVRSPDGLPATGTMQVTLTAACDISMTYSYNGTGPSALASTGTYYPNGTTGCWNVVDNTYYTCHVAIVSGDGDIGLKGDFVSGRIVGTWDYTNWAGGHEQAVGSVQ